LTIFRDFFLKAQTLPRLEFYRSTVKTLIFLKSANRTAPKHEPFYVILILKTLIWLNLLEKIDAFLYEKAFLELGAFSPRHFPLPRGKCTFLKLEFLAYIKAHFTLSR
jgi:hypothetical protein